MTTNPMSTKDAEPCKGNDDSENVGLDCYWMWIQGNRQCKFCGERLWTGYEETAE